MANEPTPATTRIALVNVDSPNWGAVYDIYPATEDGEGRALYTRRVDRSLKIVELDNDLDADVEPGERMRITGRRSY